MDAQLPDVMVENIVSNITDFHQLLKLRLVSRQWKAVIEDWLSRRKSLAIMMVGYMVHSQNNSTLQDRFFRTWKHERFMLMQLHNFYDIFNMKFTLTVVKLFKCVEHFAFRAPLTSRGVTCLNLMLNKWTNLSTLSLIVHSFRPDFESPISFAINNLENLIRLDLGAPFQMWGLGETLARIHCLAVGFIESHHQFLNMIFQIGKHCKHLWVGRWYSEVVDWKDIFDWIRANPAFFTRQLTHFGWCGNIDRIGLSVINDHFGSLTTWHVAGEHKTKYARLSLLSGLRELRVSRLLDPFCVKEITDVIRRSRNRVRTFELHEAHCSSHPANMFEVEKFIDRLRLLFPRANKIILASPLRGTIEMLKICVQGDRRFQILQSKDSDIWVCT